jgi:hypothetical protein
LTNFCISATITSKILRGGCPRNESKKISVDSRGTSLAVAADLWDIDVFIGVFGCYFDGVKAVLVLGLLEGALLCICCD